MLIALCALFGAGCAHHAARVNTTPGPARIGSTETGVASWYGIPYDGRRAASGEVYDMWQHTAAHRQLPFQTWVRVTNLDNGKQVEVRINDRGPFVKGRILDLSQAAARDIDMLRAGTARVRLKVIPPPSLPLSPPVREPVEITTTPATPSPVPVTPATEALAKEPRIDDAALPVIAATPAAEPAGRMPATGATSTGSYAVQAGSFSDPARAEAMRARLQDLFGEVRVTFFAGHTPPLGRVIVGRGLTREQAAELAIRVRRETGSASIVPEPESVSHTLPGTP